MPTKRLSMRRIQRLMTLHFGAGAPTRAIARELGISHSTVREYLARIAAAGCVSAPARDPVRLPMLTPPRGGIPNHTSRRTVPKGASLKADAISTQT